MMRFVGGDGDFNQCGNCCWNWHIDPATVEFVEVAIEACDGKPSMGTVRRYCPWGARLVRELHKSEKPLQMGKKCYLCKQYACP